MGHISQGQQASPPFEGYVPLPPDHKISDFQQKTYVPPGDDLSDKTLSDFRHYIAVHVEVSGEVTPSVISCADFTDTSVVPSTDGPISPLGALLIGGAVLATLGIAAGSFLTWRRA